MTSEDGSTARQNRPPLNFKTLGFMLRETMREWNDDKVPRLGAALAFYSMLSIGPLLLIAIAVAGAAFCVFVEYMLNSVGALTWDYTWWNRGAPWLIFLFGYLTFFIAAFWVFDMKSVKNKLITVGTIWAVDILALIVFIPILHWI